MKPLVAVCVLATALGCGHRIGDHCNTNVDCSPLGDRFCDLSAPGGYCTVEGCDVNSCPGEATCVRFFTPVASKPCLLGGAGPACATNNDCPAGIPCDAVSGHCGPVNAAPTCATTGDCPLGSLCDPISKHCGSGCTPSERCVCDCEDPNHPGHCTPSYAMGTAPSGGVLISCQGDHDYVASPKNVALGHCAPESSERRWCQITCNQDSDCRSDKDTQNRPIYVCHFTGKLGAESVPDPDAGVKPTPRAGFCVAKSN